VLERLSNRSCTRSADVVVVKAVQWERREREMRDRLPHAVALLTSKKDRESGSESADCDHSEEKKKINERERDKK
jgi:hypothetical protein